MPKSIHNSFNQKMMLFKVDQKESRYLGYFSNKICHQELSNIAQSGHTGRQPRLWSHLILLNKKLISVTDRVSGAQTSTQKVKNLKTNQSRRNTTCGKSGLCNSGWLKVQRLDEVFIVEVLFLSQSDLCNSGWLKVQHLGVLMDKVLLV